MSVSERFFAHARMSASDHRSRSYERSWAWAVLFLENPKYGVHLSF
jgi:hypothetical protein